MGFIIFQFQYNDPMHIRHLMIIALLTSFGLQRANAQETVSFDERYYNSLEWRGIGPYRGGRSAAVTGVPGKPNLGYFGATGGGVWKTTDGGSKWTNISDGYFGGSIGAVAVSTHDPNVIYVGEGEVTVRGNVSSGDGIWKSTDAGDTWEYMGLPESRHIPRIQIHPRNPDIVYAAVLGDIYKATKKRGVYKSTDGGKTWEKILYVNENAGAFEVQLDPNNPRIVYASTWRFRRTPYGFSSGGEGSALWKSKDSGENWERIDDNKGMPDKPHGVMGITVSAANSDRLYAMIEAPKGGVYRSSDQGKTWRRVNKDRALRQRAWYYSRIYADPKDEDKVYVMNVAYHKSKDGGESFEKAYAPHGDHHDLWIDPEDPDHLIIADDGGAQVSFDGGENWSTYMNQNTAQFYRVTTDEHFPYRIYGAQQDNSTVRILHRSDGGSIDRDDWEATAGGESAHIAVDPENNDIVYGGSYGGLLIRKDHEREQTRAINVWPENPMGHGVRDMKYRFQWNFPLFFSPHNPDKLYAASNHLHVTTNEGQSWKVISPDLTRDDSSKQVPTGGPITKDNTGVEYYCTIYAAKESPHEEGVIWTGSDDGLVHITRDGGENWEDITPDAMPKWAMVNSMELSPHQKGKAYLAATLYRQGDYTPYLYKTENYGQSWTRITDGIEDGDFTRVVREDPNREGLLYCGTEYGIYISFDDGSSWKPFQLNLPEVPITDLKVKKKNLIAATQGRGFWLIDDLTPLHQLKNDITEKEAHLYQPKPSYRMGGSGSQNPPDAGQNHPNGVILNYHLAEAPDSNEAVRIAILEEDGDTIRTFSNQAEKKRNKLQPEPTDSTNRFIWNMHYPPAEKFEGMVLWWASIQGPKAVPGSYEAHLITPADTSRTPFEILPDPRVKTEQKDWQAQFEFIRTINEKLTEVHRAIKDIRAIREQVRAVKAKVKGDSIEERVHRRADSIIQRISTIEKALYQTRNQSPQDPLNYPIRLNNKLAHLSTLTGMGYYPPTDQARAVRQTLTQRIDQRIVEFRKVKKNLVKAFNEMVHEERIDAVESDPVKN